MSETGWWLWLMQPLSGATQHALEGWAYWHGRLMVLAWGLLLPLGALMARYWKARPGGAGPERLDPKAWWHAHRLLQYGGSALMVLGLVLVWGRAGGATLLAQWHGALGGCLVALGGLQLLGGWLRGSKGGPAAAALRGDHYDMSPRRQRFERLHKSMGWLAVGLSVAVLLLGLAVADAPRWMLLSLLVWWCALALCAALWQRQGRCLDTYQVIWGADPAHPGNRLRPIGWGVRRWSSPHTGARP